MTLDRRSFHRFLAASAGVAAVPAVLAKARPSAATELAALADRYDAARWALFPMDATENTGDAAYEGRFEIDIAPEHRKRQESL